MSVLSYWSLLTVRLTTIASNFVFLKTLLYLISNKELKACGVSSLDYYLLGNTINPGPEAPGQVFMGSKESSGSISTISQERPPHSEQMLICVNFKQFKSILGFSFTNLSNQCWNDSKDKYRISTILGHYCIELVS